VDRVEESRAGGGGACRFDGAGEPDRERWLEARDLARPHANGLRAPRPSRRALATQAPVDREREKRDNPRLESARRNGISRPRFTR
jgi:hypothetical protein